MSQATFCLIVSSGAVAATYFWYKVCDLIKRIDRIEITMAMDNAYDSQPLTDDEGNIVHPAHLDPELR